MAHLSRRAYDHSVSITGAVKRALIGRKLRNTQIGETLLPKRVALPVFASDALSSVAYAPDEIFLTLSMAGLAAYSMNWQIGLCVALVMITVVASYRQNVHAYPSGGGDYEVASVNLGPTAGLTVASALLVDYVLTVAVSISSGVQNATAALPWLNGHEATAGASLVLLLMVMNLRGAKESGRAFAVPTYLFMIAILAMALWGLITYLTGDLPEAASASYEIAAEPPYEGAITTLAMTFLLARAFSSGCAALTGVEAISNGVPAFRRPKSRNAATTLLLLGAISISMLMSIVLLADAMQVRYVEDPAHQLLSNGVPLGESSGYVQDTVIGQLAAALYADLPVAFYLTIACTGVILVLAANTAFNGFPVLGSILARDGYLPRQMHTRGDRLAYSNGIVLLALAAVVLIVAFDAQVTKLIQMYIVGVFVSFTLSQLGMIRHWTRLLATETDAAARRRMRRSRAINSFGLLLTATVLVIVVVTKFLAGAWIAIIAMVGVFILMRAIARHYRQVAEELRVDDSDRGELPRVHGIVLVSKVHKPTMRAIAYARVTHPEALEAVTVDLDPDETQEVERQWREQGITLPLMVLDSPYREIVRPVVRYVNELRSKHPDELVTVYIPEYVVGRWWEQLLHNQTALRLKSRLLFMPGVLAVSVPYQLTSAHDRTPHDHRAAAGDVRRGFGEPR